MVFIGHNSSALAEEIVAWCRACLPSGLLVDKEGRKWD
jgi:hypothetical protein